ncbi:MAG TPA: hypothetical protein VN047_14765 [Sphingopyxis sp.]|uniref:hypothetical protein n=1 Tax=Sphingopyxis sp. TaxID=1908224 RepID=UPI002D02CD93|nr:hypothetical protein [Sphingopyxis sp.]HWW58151.1 hypothetical protein [Sphingopyxis sp.]
MTDWSGTLSLIADLAVLLGGIRVLAMGWEAPKRESLPLVVTKDDLQRYNGVLNVRQVFLFFFGMVLIIVAVSRLGH